jgi:hypothetical protein
MTTNTTAKIASFLSVKPSTIKKVTDLYHVWCVVVVGKRPIFVSKKKVNQLDSMETGIINYCGRWRINHLPKDYFGGIVFNHPKFGKSLMIKTRYDAKDLTKQIVKSFGGTWDEEYRLWRIPCKTKNQATQICKNFLSKFIGCDFLLCVDVDSELDAAAEILQKWCAENYTVTDRPFANKVMVAEIKVINFMNKFYSTSVLDVA